MYFGGKSLGQVRLQVDFFILFPNASSKSSKVVSSLRKLNFDFFAGTISKGNDLGMISYPMEIT